MTTADRAGTKVCIYCNEDCSDRPRLRSPDGRYACRACAQGAAPSSPPPPSPTAAPEIPFTLAPADEPERRKPCPACGGSMGADSVICGRCGYDDRRGFRRGAGVGATSISGGVIACRKCGYSLEGLRTPVCPECGTHVTPPSLEEDRELTSRQAAREGLIRPLSYCAVMALIIPAVRLLQGNTPQLPYDAGLFLLSYLVGIPLYTACALVWIGLTSTFNRLLVSLAGAYAATITTWAVLDAVFPYMFLPYIAALLVFVGTLSDLAEIDFNDAAVVAMVNVAAAAPVSLLVIALLGL